jgi:hypothetical protein
MTGTPDALGAGDGDSVAVGMQPERLGVHDRIAEGAREGIDGVGGSDGAATQVEVRALADGRERRHRAPLPDVVHLCVLDTRVVEAAGVLVQVWSGDQDPLLTDQRPSEPLLPARPGATGTHREGDQPRRVVPVPEDPCAARRLARSGTRRLEAAYRHAAVLGRECGGETDDAGAHHDQVALRLHWAGAYPRGREAKRGDENRRGRRSSEQPIRRRTP